MVSPTSASPSPLLLSNEPVFTRAINGSGSGTDSVSWSVTLASGLGGVPVTVAVLSFTPASMSAWVMV